ARLVRIGGVSGDLVPILEPRWSRETSPGPVSAPATPLGPVASPAETPSAAPEAPPLVTTAPAVATRPAVPSRHAGDFPQFLGARRDGTVTGVRLARDWSTRMPRRLWRHQVGEGWSGFAAGDDGAVTQEQRGGAERVVAFDLLTGRLRWSPSDAARFDTVIGGIGPRATPTIADGRVFTMGATGILNALDLASGRRLWTHQAVEENGA